MTSADIIPMNKNPLLAAAISYAALGWRILPCWWIENGTCACGNTECKSPGKHPIHKLVKNGQDGASADIDFIKSWWGQCPNANIAVFLGPSGLCAIDLDPRNGGVQTMDDIEAKHGSLVSDLLQFSGGGGEHRVFRKPENQNLPGKLGPGVDVKLNGYIMLEPSNHISGGTYAWEASSDPREGCCASPLPDWLRDLAGPKAALPERTTQPRVMRITIEQQDEIEQAVYAIPSGSRDNWLNVGMGLQSTGEFQWAFDLWDKWSQQSSKYDPVDQARVWNSFRAKGLDGITYKTIFALAKEHGTMVRAIPAPVPIEQVTVAKVAPDMPTPANLLTPPGVLGTVTDWVNATARKPQPMFAVQTAIAFAATVLGRRFVTTQRNWPSLYLLNIGLSASGKEHAKTAVEQLLEACELSCLIGPASYTSNSGVLSALHSQPTHLTVIDEFGKELEQASIKNNARAQSMMKSLIEVWGRCDGTLRPQGFSTFGMSAQDAKKMSERSVRNPALSLLAMTTPGTFFDSIGSAAARDGFLNRFLIVESDIGRQVNQMTATLPVPTSVIDWAKAMQAASNGLVDPTTSPGMSTAPVEVDMSRAAMYLFKDFDAECVGLMDQYEQHGLAEMFGRTNEIAMRLALIVAVGCSSTLPITVDGPSAAWAIQYVRHHALRTVERLVTSVSDSEFEAIKQQVMNLLKKQSNLNAGMTVPRIYDSSAKFRGLNKRQQLELLDSLRFAGKVENVVFPPASGRGPSRNAWVAVQTDEIE